jgi:hypothetical protein
MRRRRILGGAHCGDGDQRRLIASHQVAGGPGRRSGSLKTCRRCVRGDIRRPLLNYSVIRPAGEVMRRKGELMEAHKSLGLRRDHTQWMI